MKLQENILYEVYTNDPDNFNVGYYWAQDDEYILIHSLSVDGLDSGLTLIQKDYIDHVEYETQYCEKLLKLNKYHKVEMRKNVFTQGNLIEQAMRYAMENKSIVSAVLRESDRTDLYGFISGYDKDFIYIDGIDTYGFKDGKSTARIGDVSVLGVDDYRDLRDKILYNINYGKASE